jgi:hypothetical protein
MFVGFSFNLSWYDNDLLNLRFKAWNGAFGGTAEIYVAVGDLQKAADQLRGFPVSPSDSREIVFGNFDRKCAAGGVRTRFHCVNGAGHAYVEATIDSNRPTGGIIETAVLALPVEATAIDVFVQDLERLEIQLSGTAYLKGTGCRF